MSSRFRRRSLTLGLLPVIWALIVQVMLVPTMALGSGWAVLCSPDGTRTVVPVGGPAAPGGLGDCELCPVCPKLGDTSGPLAPAQPTLVSGPRIPSASGWTKIENESRSFVLAVPVGRRAPPAA